MYGVRLGCLGGSRAGVFWENVDWEAVNRYSRA